MGNVGFATRMKSRSDWDEEDGEDGDGGFVFKPVDKNWLAFVRGGAWVACLGSFRMEQGLCFRFECSIPLTNNVHRV